MMTDEQIQQALQEASDALDRLPEPDKPLSREEKKQRGKFLRRKEVLSQIKAAKEKKQKDAELYHTMMYDMILSVGEKHPVLMFLTMTMMRIRWGAGSFQRL